ncbi:GntR family transcriptional regulator [Catenulispora sp. NF23]|uniref:GntR family transcriptional regulator n=1 Tax=Catenulispora pinistramenti TaxID=2705254 RepID=UPI001BADB2B5|nr:GntR family transcriptional regulator [Catenulispora pinistramenti]MBS2531255.1 GntR family transcriptional regulator [Catenulispora pinistramenti]
MRRLDDRPRHLQIAADLRAKILSGDLTEKLPPFKRLQEIYDTSNNTTQRAVALLKAEGFVEGQQGKALLIRAKRVEIIDATPYFEPAVTHVRYVMLHIGPDRPPADAARNLGLAAEEAAILRKRLTIRDNIPIELSWSYYPTPIATGSPLERPQRIRGGAPTALADLGLLQHEFVDEIQVRQPTSEELEALELPAGIPVMRTLRTISTEDGTVVEVVVMVKGGHLYGMRYRQTLPPIG